MIIAGTAWRNLVGEPAPPVNRPPAEARVAGLAAAFVAVLFTIGRWQQLNMMAGEIRRREWTIPRALTVGIAIVVAIYLGMNAVYLHVLGRDGLAASLFVVAAGIGIASAYVAAPQTSAFGTVLPLAGVVVFVIRR